MPPGVNEPHVPPGSAGARQAPSIFAVSPHAKGEAGDAVWNCPRFQSQSGTPRPIPNTNAIRIPRNHGMFAISIFAHERKNCLAAGSCVAASNTCAPMACPPHARNPIASPPIAMGAMAPPPSAASNATATPPKAIRPSPKPPNANTPIATPPKANPPVATPPKAMTPCALPPMAMIPFATRARPVWGSMPEVTCNKGSPKSVALDR